MVESMAKDGEICIIRKNVQKVMHVTLIAQLENENLELRNGLVQAKTDAQNAAIRTQHDLQKDIERLQTELMFKVILSF
jgi:hypothetical protein